MSGTDSRMLVDANGLNRYGCSGHPRDVLALGSCTCSSPSPRASDAARRCLDRIRETDNPHDEIERSAESIRDVLGSRLGLPNNVEVALTPSGTDVELLALAIADGAGDREIVNVVVGPTEVGSGTLHVAAARHFDEYLPCGEAAVIGEAIDKQLAARVSVKTVDVRDAGGRILSAPEIDAQVVPLVADAAARNARVLLHVVAHSKTGIYAPRWSSVDQIARTMKEDVVVLVDAAQGRIERQTYRDALRRGFLVSFTGSKFFGGPPFSGALLVPSVMNPAARGLQKFPSGFDKYFTPSDMPATWQDIRANMTRWHNVGLLLRWVAAITEIESFYSLSGGTRRRIIEAFAMAVTQVFSDLESVTLIKGFSGYHAVTSCPSIETTPTVFGVLVKDEQRVWSRSELKQLHALLNQDLSDASYPGDQDAMRRCFHLGQPVEIGVDQYVLRIALGSPWIVDVANDPTAGKSVQQTKAWFVNQLEPCKQKLCRLLETNIKTAGTAGIE